MTSPILIRPLKSTTTINAGLGAPTHHTTVSGPIQASMMATQSQSPGMPKASAIVDEHGTRKRGQDAGENEKYADRSEQPTAKAIVSGPAERDIFGDQGPWGLLALEVAIVLFIVIGGLGFFFGHS